MNLKTRIIYTGEKSSLASQKIKEDTGGNVFVGKRCLCPKGVPWFLRFSKGERKPLQLVYQWRCMPRFSERFYFLFSLHVQHFRSASLWHETIHYQLDLHRECISAQNPWQGLPRVAGAGGGYRIKMTGILVGKLEFNI